MIHATLLKGRTLELMARKKNVTFNDIAQYTHFSKTTISRYFNNPDSLKISRSFPMHWIN